MIAKKSALKVAIVQYAGDFREAAVRLASDGVETYRGQKYTVEAVEKLAEQYAEVVTITGFTDTPYDVVLESGARAIGLGFKTRWDPWKVVSALIRLSPDRVVLRTADPIVLWYVSLRRIPSLAMLADSFQGTSLRRRVSRRLLVSALNRGTISRVANHGRNAAAHLVDLGVSADKVVAWDYPAFNEPSLLPAKSGASGASILFVGMLSFEKGVGDVIEAANMLVKKYPDLRVSLVGGGPQERELRALVSQYTLENVVHFDGLVPNAQIIERMREADVVVVPSHHSYSEGMPLTIYEAFCSRTPLVVSDHPMFTDNVVDEFSGLVFPAAQWVHLAGAIERLLSDPTLYGALSKNSDAAWRGLQIPDKWDRIIYDWLDDTKAIEPA